ncbi:MAG: hypothetical protein R3Y09_13805 [Clostridia bacterium]
MKKFILPVIANIIILAVLPFSFDFLDEGTAKSAWIGMMVVGNSVYFFVQGQFYSTKYKQGWILILINLISTLLYMYIFITQIVWLYIAFYTVMMALGMRVGSNKRKLIEFRNKDL